MRKVIIEPWNADSTYVHVHETDCRGINHPSSDTTHEMTVERATSLGILSHMLLVRSDGMFLRDYHTCIDFIKMLEGVQAYTEANIVEARDQLEDAGFEDVENLTDDHVAFYSWYAIEFWVEHARDCTNPFTDDLQLRGGIIRSLSNLIKSTEGSKQEV